MSYVYRMKETSGDSSIYGNCECCGRPANTMYLLTQMKTYINVLGKQSLTMYKCFQKFGHKSCLSELT